MLEKPRQTQPGMYRMNKSMDMHKTDRNTAREGKLNNLVRLQAFNDVQSFYFEARITVGFSFNEIRNYNWSSSTTTKRGKATKRKLRCFHTFDYQTRLQNIIEI